MQNASMPTVGSGGIPPSGKFLTLYTSQITSDAIWDKIYKHFDDTYLCSVNNI